MFEKTNQTMEENEMENLPENLFDDEAGVETDEASKEEQSGGETNQGQDGDGASADENHVEESAGSSDTAIRVKYNGEERDISLEEARTLAQKGMNYDHVVAERDKNRNAFEFLLERAKGEGITVEEFIERERGKTEEKKLEDKMSEIRERDDDASEETIKSLARLELEMEKNRAERKSTQALEEKNKAEVEGWNKLFREHPELIATAGEPPKVSKGIFDLVKAGHTPIEAYYIERNRELEAQNKMMSDVSAAKKKSIGSLAGVQNTDEDDFLSGFNAE